MKLIVSFLTLMLASSLALANAKVVGNAGKVVVCKNPEGKITSAEVLDLYEGRVLYKLNYTESDRAFIRQALGFVGRLTRSLGLKRHGEGSLAADLKGIVSRVHMLPPGTGLKPTQDSSEFLVPRGCEIVQVVNYRTWEQIYVDSDIWTVLSPTQKAALLFHETVYARLRYAGEEQDSDRARKMVAYVVSGQALPEYTPLPKTTWRCLTENAPQGESDKYTDFFAYPDGNGAMVARFSKIYGHDVLMPTEVASEKNLVPAWPLPQGLDVVFRGRMNSLVDANVKTTIRMDDQGQGEIGLRGVDYNDKTLTQKFNCRPWFQ